MMTTILAKNQSFPNLFAKLPEFRQLYFMDTHLHKEKGCIWIYYDNVYVGRITNKDLLFSASAKGMALSVEKKWHIWNVLGILEKDFDRAITDYGKDTGRCVCCGKKLTNPDSIALGIGPECAKSWGITPSASLEPMLEALARNFE